PIGSVAAAAVILGESPSALQLLGAVAVLGALLVATTTRTAVAGEWFARRGAASREARRSYSPRGPSERSCARSEAARSRSSAACSRSAVASALTTVAAL